MDTVKKFAFPLTAAAVFLVFLLIIFRAFVFDSNTLMLNSDQLNGLGSRILRAENAVLSEWDDSRLGGVPTIDALFGDAYHPLVWVQFLTDPARAVGFKFILTIWIAFCSAMLLARSLTKNNWVALLLGFLYAFSPQYFTYIYGGHDGKMMVFAIAPLAILSIRKIIREKKFSFAFLLSLSIVWMILGSHLQLTYLFLWGAGLYALYEMFSLKAPWKTRAIRLSITAIALFFGLSMSAFQILPPYLYTTKESVRGTGEKTNYGHAVSWSLHQEELGALVIPGFIGVDVYEQTPKGTLEGSSLLSFEPSEFRGLGASPFYWGHNPFKLNHDSVGTILFALAFLCFFLPGKRRYAAFWFCGATLALSYAMGAHSPLFKLWYEILPGVKNFRAPSMALFWLPLLCLMMAAPVLKSHGEKDFKHLSKGAFLLAILFLFTLCARFFWESFLGPLGLFAIILYGILFTVSVHLVHVDKKLSVENFADSFKSGFRGSSKWELIAVFFPFLFLGVVFLSGQNILSNPETALYFKPLNTLAMQLGQTKMLPSFLLAAIVIGLTFVLLKKKIPLQKLALALLVLAAVELFTIDKVFIQNVPYNEYIQPKNPLAEAFKRNFPEKIEYPRVLSLSRNRALSGNVFPVYGLRNAEGFHDNELASYRAFRGGQNNENFMIGLSEENAPRPFLDLANIAAVIFDSRQGTTYLPNQTAMGEAFLYGNAIVLNDEEAIETLKKAKVRTSTTDFSPDKTSPNEEDAASKIDEEKNQNESKENQSVNSEKKESLAEAQSENTSKTAPENSAETTSETVAESASGNASENSAESVTQTPAENLNAETVRTNDSPEDFFYKETIILSEAPKKALAGGIPKGYAKLVKREKMDTQIFEVESDRDAILFVSGNYHPYWRAFVNGKESKIYKAFGTFRAVEIPKGKSTVQMEYRSKPFHATLKFSIASAILFALLFLGYACVSFKKSNSHR